MWFESQLFETNLVTSKGARIAMWIELRLVLTFEAEESSLKSAVPGQTPEAKVALRQGKLPKEARFRATNGEHEYAFTFKADTLSLSGLRAPRRKPDAKEDDMAEVLKDRMRLTDELEAISSTSASSTTLLALRLSAAWAKTIVPALLRFAKDRKVDVDAYPRGEARAARQAREEALREGSEAFSAQDDREEQQRAVSDEARRGSRRRRPSRSSITPFRVTVK